MTKIKLRFAPSPTGNIHVGNLRTALINWLYALKNEGEFLLRFDDTDKERSRDEYATAIEKDLRWLGINPHEIAWQSKRFDRYAEVVEKLKSEGRLYPCYETPEELERKRKRQLSRGKPPVYDRAARDLTPEQIADFEAEGRQAHWRFLLEDRGVEFEDAIRGKQVIQAGSLSDPILIRGDGSYLYTLPSVVDDIDFKISHIVRGEDHVANTGVQVQLFEALGAQAPVFAHHNLLTSADGTGLSKRLGSLSIKALAEQGLEPQAVASHAALIGTSDPVQPIGSMKELADMFEFSKLSRAPARFDPEELEALNAKYLSTLAYESVVSRLTEKGISGSKELIEPFWMTVRENINLFDEVETWWACVTGPITPVIEDTAFAGEASRLLPEGGWDIETWGVWTNAVKEKTGAKGKELFMPLRLALTGKNHGPELKYLLPLIGREKAMKRLSGESA